jgi:hypothetical protein
VNAAVIERSVSVYLVYSNEHNHKINETLVLLGFYVSDLSLKFIDLALEKGKKLLD